MNPLMTRGQFLKSLLALAVASQIRTPEPRVVHTGTHLYGKTFVDATIRLDPGYVLIRNCGFVRCKFEGKAQCLLLDGCRFEEMVLTLNGPGVVANCVIRNPPSLRRTDFVRSVDV